MAEQSGWRQRYQRAALAYFAYGSVYLGAAVLQLTPDRKHDFMVLPWWSFFVIGIGLAVGLPLLVRKGLRRFTQVLSIFPAIKAMTVLLKQGKLLGAGEPTNIPNWFLIVAALVASAALFRAGFGPEQRPSEE